MEIKIGIQNVARELVVHAEMTADEVQAKVAEALSSGAPLVLQDSKGGTAVVPAASIGYVETGQETKRKVGFPPLPLGGAPLGGTAAGTPADPRRRPRRTPGGVGAFAGTLGGFQQDDRSSQDTVTFSLHPLRHRARMVVHRSDERPGGYVPRSASSHPRGGPRPASRAPHRGGPGTGAGDGAPRRLP